MKKRRRVNPDTIVLLKQILRGFLVLSVLALVVLGVWHGTRLEAVTIVTVEVSGGETIKHEVVRELANIQLQGTYLGLVPRTFSFMYPEDDITRAVSELERVYNVRVSRPDWRTLKVEFNEYTPYALWCSEDDNEGCLFIDDTGYAFGRAPDLRGGSFLRLTSLGQEPVVGEMYAGEAVFRRQQELVTRLEDFGWYPRHIILDQVGDVSVFLTGDSELKVNGNESPATIMDNLQTVLLIEEFSQLAPGDFAYIDLRFGNKVYVSIDGIPVEEELPTATTTAEDGENMTE
jgi:cell division septal protein FtsQ